jgi:hypothetical protein
MSARPSAAELLRTPGALLTRSDLRELGLERRAVDAVFRKLPVIVLEGYSRPLFAVDEYVALLADSTYCARCPRCGLRAARAAGIGFAPREDGLVLQWRARAPCGAPGGNRYSGHRRTRP